MELKLLRNLLNISHDKDRANISLLLKAVSNTIPSIMCSLWKVNNNSKTLSIYSREGYSPDKNNEKEFVHPIDGSLIGYLMENSPESGFFDIPDITNSTYYKYHKSKDRITKLGLKRMISVLISNYENSDYIDAVLNIYPKKEFIFEKKHAKILCLYFSRELSRKRLLDRERVTHEIVGIYEQRISKDLSSVLHPIINRILNKYCKYEGCSIFSWDPFINRLSLSQTTGIKNKPFKEDVYYYLGVGLTGYLAEEKKSAILADLNNIVEDDFARSYEHKWQEETPHQGTSFMSLPIMSPSHSNELLGIIRFVNRLNMLSPVVDTFSKQDFDLISHACNLIALYMEQEKNGKIQTVFAMQMAHEMLTPAVAIRSSARRLQQRISDEEFVSLNGKKYLQSIQEHADLQAALTRTIEFAWSGRSEKPKSKRYQVSKVNFREGVIDKARKLVIPIARKEGLQFSNIKIEGYFPNLVVDKFAFEQVFFNILTNAIKYRKQDSLNSFSVKINCQGLGSYGVPTIADYNSTNLIQQGNVRGYLIQIEDNGVGISKEEAKKIFLLGYRTKNIEETNVRGLGMGLAVCKRVLHDFYCYIWVSNFQNPTRFNILLPDILHKNDYLYEDDWKSTYKDTTRGTI